VLRRWSSAAALLHALEAVNINVAVRVVDFEDQPHEVLDGLTVGASGLRTALATSATCLVGAIPGSMAGLAAFDAQPL
jgi:hypothetical protein